LYDYDLVSAPRKGALAVFAPAGYMPPITPAAIIVLELCGESSVAPSDCAGRVPAFSVESGGRDPPSAHSGARYNPSEGGFKQQIDGTEHPLDVQAKLSAPARSKR
jgi:hypothetical protein